VNVIELIGVAKRYRRVPTGPLRLRRITEWKARTNVWALRDVSFAVGEGEALGLVGRNGSGKSTMLRLLAGVTYPTQGSISVSRRVSGLLTLGEGFHPLLSGEENALTQAILSGLTRREAVARLPQIAAFAELEHYMDQQLRTFSDGMRLRLGFAVAINVDPEILLIDEILAVGDLGFRKKCFDYIDGLQASGVTVIMASHDLSQVRRMCNKAVWLADGEVRHLGDATEVVERYERAVDDALPRREVGDLRNDRIGSGEVEITDVSLLDGHGDGSNSLISDGAAAIEIDFVAHQPTHDAIFVVSVHDEDKTMCLDVSTAGDGHTIGRLEDRGTVRLDVERLELPEGSYWLDVGIYEADWDRPYDYVWEVLPFRVSRAKLHNGSSPPRSWSLR
jgi:lipopolysaccharide transport system ATP-binding protein